MTTGLVGGVGGVSGDFSHGMYRTKNMKMTTAVRYGSVVVNSHTPSVKPFTRTISTLRVACIHV